MQQPGPFVIIDGNSLMHRAFHALPPLQNGDGVFTNAVFGFLSMLLKVVETEQPAYLAVAFDLHGPTFRHADYSEYKAGRKPTAPELRPLDPAALPEAREMTQALCALHEAVCRELSAL